MAPVEELVMHCFIAREEGSPDLASEAVVADWCEENGLAAHAASIRAGVAAAFPHLCHWLAEPAIGPSLFFDARAYFRAIGASDWADAADGLVRMTLSSSHFSFARSFQGEGTEKLTRVDRCYAEDLVVGASHAYFVERHSGRLCNFRDALRRPCPTCTALAVVLVRDDTGVDAAQDPHWITRVLTLCLREPHVVELGSSTDDYAPL